MCWRHCRWLSSESSGALSIAHCATIHCTTQSSTQYTGHYTGLHGALRSAPRPCSVRKRLHPSPCRRRGGRSVFRPPYTYMRVHPMHASPRREERALISDETTKELYGRR